MQQLSVTFTPTNTADYNATTTLRIITVGFSQACLTGSLSGSLTIKSGNAYCIQGGKVSGSITVQSGGSLYISGGAISGSITSTGATALTLCGTSVSGSIEHQLLVRPGRARRSVGERLRRQQALVVVHPEREQRRGDRGGQHDQRLGDGIEQQGRRPLLRQQGARAGP